MAFVAVGSDCPSEFVECCGDPEPASEGVDAELGVTASQALREACPRITTLAVRSVCRPRSAA